MKRITVFPILSLLLLVLPSFVICPDQAFLGIESSDMTEEKARLLGFENPYGSYVSRVIPNTAAEKAGLQPFDYITGVDNKTVSEDEDLMDILEGYEPGDEATIHFFRKGTRQSIKVALGEMPLDWDEIEMPETDAFLGVSEIGPSEDSPEPGVAVEIVPLSAADAMGLQDGDVITSIDGYPMLDWDDITTLVYNAQPGQDIQVRYYRNGEMKETHGALLSSGDEYEEEAEWEDESQEEEEEWAQQPDPDEQQPEDRAFMGIYAEMVSKEKAMKMGLEHNFGTLVTGVIPNTGADKAGLQLFDYLYGIDTYRAGEGQHFGFILGKYKPGDTAKLHFIRRGQARSTDITFGKKPEGMEEMKEMNKCEDTFLGIMSTEDIEPDYLGDIRVKPVENSTAMDIGLKEGDVIKTINGYPMYDWMDIGYLLDNLKPGDPITVGYLRDGKEGKASGKIKSFAATKNCKDCDCSELMEWKNDIKVVVPDIRIEIPNAPKPPRAPEPPQRADVSAMNVDVQDATDAEIRQVNEKANVQLRSSNSLSVQNLKISPNPHEGHFTLAFNLPQRGPTAVRIFNAQGRMIYEYDLGDFSGAFSDQIDIAQNGQGTYFLEIRQGDKSTAKKLLLN